MKCRLSRLYWFKCRDLLNNRWINNSIFACELKSSSIIYDFRFSFWGLKTKKLFMVWLDCCQLLTMYLELDLHFRKWRYMQNTYIPHTLVCVHCTVQTQLTSHNQSPDSWWKWIEILYRHNKYINTTMYANIKLVSSPASNSDGIPSRL